MNYEIYKPAEDPKLYIQGFMGGTLEIPMAHADKVHLFILELYQIEGVKEVFDRYGAILNPE